MSFIKSFISLFVLFSLFGCGADRPVWREVVETEFAATSQIKVDKRGNSLVFAYDQVLQFDANGVKRWGKGLPISKDGLVFLPNPGAGDSEESQSEIQHISYSGDSITWSHWDHDGNEIASISLEALEGDRLIRKSIQVDAETETLIAAVSNVVPENQVMGLYRFSSEGIEKVVALSEAPKDFLLLEDQFFVLTDKFIHVFSKQGESLRALGFAREGVSENFVDLGNGRFAVARSLAVSIEGNTQEIVVMDLAVNEEISHTLLNDDKLALVESSVSSGDFYFLQERSGSFNPESLLDNFSYHFVTIMNRDGITLEGFKVLILDDGSDRFSVLKGYDNTLYVQEAKATANIKDQYNQEWYFRTWSQIGQYDNDSLLAKYKSGVQTLLMENKQPSGWDLPVIIPLSAPILHHAFGVDEQGNVYVVGTAITQPDIAYVEKLEAK